jgi:hypothetical protein
VQIHSEFVTPQQVHQSWSNERQREFHEDPFRISNGHTSELLTTGTHLT